MSISKNNTTVTKDGDISRVALHNTTVFEINESTMQMILRSGGHVSNTTQSRINQALAHFIGDHIKVTRKGGAFQLIHSGDNMGEFTDEMSYHVTARAVLATDGQNIQSIQQACQSAIDDLEQA